MKRTGIAELADNAITQASGGQLQRFGRVKRGLGLLYGMERSYAGSAGLSAFLCRRGSLREALNSMYAKQVRRVNW